MTQVAVICTELAVMVPLAGFLLWHDRRRHGASLPAVESRPGDSDSFNFSFDAYIDEQVKALRDWFDYDDREIAWIEPDHWRDDDYPR